jgi:hypothetical protein
MVWQRRAVDGKREGLIEGEREGGRGGYSYYTAVYILIMCSQAI